MFSVILPKSVILIGKNAFRDCIKLNQVTINGNQISEIGESAFQGCSDLQEVNYNGTKDVKYGKDVFLYCHSFKEVYVCSNYLDDTFCKMPINRCLSALT